MLNFALNCSKRTTLLLAAVVIAPLISSYVFPRTFFVTLI